LGEDGQVGGFEEGGGGLIMTPKRRLLYEHGVLVFQVAMICAVVFFGLRVVAFSDPRVGYLEALAVGFSAVSLMFSVIAFSKRRDALLRKQDQANWTLEDRIEELERLKREGHITADEYAECCMKLAKREATKIALTKSESSVPTRLILRSVEDRFDELERLKRRDMITSEEYAAKRQEILKDL
jgi:hypothetical protein